MKIKTDENDYYARIKELNISHYREEISYYECCCESQRVERSSWIW